MFDKLLALISKNLVIKSAAVILLFVVWLFAHHTMLSYGSDAIPLHKTYIGDEQSPVNAGLHILKDKNILAIRDSGTYYGPVMAMLSIPAIIGDLTIHYISGDISSIGSYRDYVVWDWGGIMYNVRIIVALAGFMGLMAAFLLVREVVDKRSAFPAIVGVMLLATNLIYFEYSSFFRVWIFILSLLLWQLYLLVLITKNKISIKNGFMISALLGVLSFGLNYVSIVLQIFWLPYLYEWLKNKRKELLRGFIYFSTVYIIGAILIIAWYPNPFFRIVHMGVSNKNVTNHADVIATMLSSLSYYGEIFITGSLPLMIAFGLLLFFGWKKAPIEIKRFSFSLLMIGIVYSLLILFVGWKEGRYVLPLIVMVIIGTAVFLGVENYRTVRGISSVFVQKLIYSLLILQVVFAMVVILKMASFYALAPSERNIIQSLDPSDTIVVSRTHFFGMDGLVGVAHTKEAYESYFKEMNLEVLDYYQYLLNTNPLATVPRFNIYYTDFDTHLLSKKLLTSANHYVDCQNPNWDYTMPLDPFDINVFQLFYPDGMTAKCYLLK